MAAYTWVFIASYRAALQVKAFLGLSPAPQGFLRVTTLPIHMFPPQESQNTQELSRYSPRGFCKDVKFLNQEHSGKVSYKYSESWLFLPSTSTTSPTLDPTGTTLPPLLPRPHFQAPVAQSKQGAERDEAPESCLGRLGQS